MKILKRLLITTPVIRFIVYVVPLIWHWIVKFFTDKGFDSVANFSDVVFYCLVGFAILIYIMFIILFLKWWYDWLFNDDDEQSPFKSNK